MMNSNLSIETITADIWTKYRVSIMHLQAQSYEAGRQDSAEYFESLIKSERHVSLIALDNRQTAGYTFAAALEVFDKTGGVCDDINLGKQNTLYSADVTVSKLYRNQGLGYALKSQQIEQARKYGYLYLSGRNRVGLAQAMWNMNLKFGAKEVCRIANAYTDGPMPREAIYYRINLHPN